jgi:hypothetical protein
MEAALPDRTSRHHNIVFIDPTGTGLCEQINNIGEG